MKKKLEDSQSASKNMLRAYQDDRNKKRQTVLKANLESKKSRWKTILVNVGKAVEKKKSLPGPETEITEWLDKFKVVLNFVTSDVVNMMNEELQVNSEKVWVSNQMDKKSAEDVPVDSSDDYEITFHNLLGTFWDGWRRIRMAWSEKNARKMEEPKSTSYHLHAGEIDGSSVVDKGQEAYAAEIKRLKKTISDLQSTKASNSDSRIQSLEFDLEKIKETLNRTEVTFMIFFFLALFHPTLLINSLKSKCSTKCCSYRTKAVGTIKKC